MSRRGWCPRKFVPVAALAAALVLAAVPARAEPVGGGDAGDDSAIGAIAAVGCGLSIRALQYTGPNTPVIVVAVSTCLLALVDAWAS